MENTSGAEPSSFTFSCIIKVENCKPDSVTGRLVKVEAKLWVPEGKEVLQRGALTILSGNNWARASEDILYCQGGQPSRKSKMALFNTSL